MPQTGMLLVGAAVRTVAVPEGTAMSGYAARTSGSTGTHDPLTVRALVIGRIALVAVDCCVLHEDTCAAARSAAIAGGDVDEVVVHATHTHSGPCVGWGRAGVDEAEVRVAVTAAVVAAVAEAAGRRVPCTVWFSETFGADVARDRRHPERRIDPPVQSVGFDHDGRRVATLVTYACHPVVLDAANTLISGDFIAPLRDRVEQAHPGSVCIYATGTAGDVNPGDFSPESSYVPGGEGHTFAEAARIGGILAEAALEAPVRRIDAQGAAFATAPVTLDLQPEADVDADVRAWRDELARGTARTTLLEEWLRWAENRPQGTGWTGRVSTISAGALRIACLPGEPFLAASDRLRAAHDGPVLVLGYCDGVAGYLPDEAEYAHGGYEVADAHRYYGMPAPFARGSLERVIEAAAEILS
ncbi:MULTISPECIES: alkaline ceramidase [unclassified Microbacterium]|uniref:alkaline ceramidase n=1 Tax=unclassified Microbacterium TaxID=2609290 RepID=UPI0012FBED73|nr:alkaline ceramidase [Microbacterium sp. MAH-37]MVQ41380.1 alkaline ceramidase [Microbacterium sp. MAH-37]